MGDKSDGDQVYLQSDCKHAVSDWVRQQIKSRGNLKVKWKPGWAQTAFSVNTFFPACMKHSKDLLLLAASIRLQQHFQISHHLLTRSYSFGTLSSRTLRWRSLERRTSRLSWLPRLRQRWVEPDLSKTCSLLFSTSTLTGCGCFLWPCHSYAAVKNKNEKEEYVYIIEHEEDKQEGTGKTGKYDYKEFSFSPNNILNVGSSIDVF